MSIHSQVYNELSEFKKELCQLLEDCESNDYILFRVEQRVDEILKLVEEN